MPFMNWVKTPDGYKPVEITDEEMVAQNTVKRAEREKMERIREQLEVGDMEREKMEFDKSRVFTALNADELKAGDKVIVGSSLLELKTNVECNRRCGNIVEIGGECSNRRFTVDDVDGRGETYWELAYLVERKENCLNCSTSCMGKSWLADQYTRCDSYKPIAKTENCTNCGNRITCARQMPEHPELESCNDWKPREPKPEQKNCYNCRLTYTRDGVMRCMMNDHRCNNPEVACNHYEPTTFEKHYRPFKDTDELIKVFCEKTPKIYDKDDEKLFMPYIWVRKKDCGSELLITGYNKPDGEVFIVDAIDLTQLFDNFTFLDGSVCGVEE